MQGQLAEHDPGGGEGANQCRQATTNNDALQAAPESAHLAEKPGTITSDEITHHVFLAMVLLANDGNGLDIEANPGQLVDCVRGLAVGFIGAVRANRVGTARA